MSKKKKTGSKPDEKTAELDAAVADTAETTASVDASIAEAEETQDAGPGKLGREGLEDQVVAAMAAAKADVEFEGSVIKVYGETPAAAKDNAAVVWRTIDRLRREKRIDKLPEVRQIVGSPDNNKAG